MILLIVCCLTFSASAETFSILGDSWSTFFGYSTPETNVAWYPSWFDQCEGYGSGNDVLTATDTWWYMLTEHGMELVENRSYSGSPVCYDGWGECNNDAVDISFVTRVQGMQDVDLIIIEGGLNDSAVNAMLGEYKYADWNESDFITFRPALAYVLDYLLTHTNAELVFMKCPMMQESYSESIDEICAHYGVPVLALHDIRVTKSHPNQMGMLQICKQITEFINTTWERGSIKCLSEFSLQH